MQPHATSQLIFCIYYLTLAFYIQPSRDHFFFILKNQLACSTQHYCPLLHWFFARATVIYILHNQINCNCSRQCPVLISTGSLWLDFAQNCLLLSHDAGTTIPVIISVVLIVLVSHVLYMLVIQLFFKSTTMKLELRASNATNFRTTVKSPISHQNCTINHSHPHPE